MIILMVMKMNNLDVSKWKEFSLISVFKEIESCKCSNASSFLEIGEDISECAQREVEEETGVKGLFVLGKRVITYHIYKQDQRWLLKETHWYNMYYDHKEDLCPQTEEDIEICAWKKPKKLKKLLKNSFSSLQEVFKGEF